MGGLFAAAIGSLLATCGFLVMLNPMRLAVLAPGARGYYQRMVLDAFSRNQLRLLGALLCTFGLCLGAAGLGGVFSSPALESISHAFLVLSWLVFIFTGVAGVILALVRFARGQGVFDWFQSWRTGSALGEIDIYPPVTPKMRREAILFATVFGALVSIAIVVGLVLGS